MARFIRIIAAFLITMLVALPLVAQTQGLDILLSKTRSLEARGRMDLAAQNWKQVLLQNAISMAIIAYMFRANNAAHFGGLVTGALLGFAFTKESRKLKLDALFGVFAGLLLALCIASVALSVASPIWRIVRAQEMSQEY